LQKRKRKKDWSLRSVKYAVLCANATMLKEKEKKKDWSLRSVRYAVLLSHVRLFVRVSP
jgi:hypothetical protein